MFNVAKNSLLLGIEWLLMHNDVRQLSLSKVFQRFIDGKNLIIEYSQLVDVKWLIKSMFFIYLCQYVNDLNVKL